MMRSRQHHDHFLPSRRGVAILESAIVLGILMTMLLGGLDLSLAVMRENTLAEAARRLARTAIVHGQSAAAINTPWGPTSYEGTADEDTEMADAIRPILVTVNPADVQIRLEWPDGDNDPGSRVQVILSSGYRPILASLFGADPYNLNATSMMRIEH